MYLHFQQYLSYLVVVSIIGGGNPGTRRKSPTYRNKIGKIVVKAAAGRGR
jgi:hypothetical protein